MPRNETYLDLYNDLEESVSTIATGHNTCFPVHNFFLYKDNHAVGVAIPTQDLLNVQKVYPVRKFHMCSRIGLPPAQEGNYLTLSVPVSFDLSNVANRSLFLDMCLQFVSLEDGNRQRLLANPHKWAKEKIEILGNKSTDNQPYPYIAEFHLLHALDAAGLVQDVRQEYRGPEGGVHDFEMASFSLEVKSHLHADETDKPGEVTISSDKQLSLTGTKPLYLVYYKMEETGDMSLKNCIDSFDHKRDIALEKLESLKKFYEGDLYWEAPYHLLEEPLVYPVTDGFPRITPLKFVGGQTPAGVTKLIYHISLANLPCCTLSEFIAAKQQGREPEYRTN